MTTTVVVVCPMAYYLTEESVKTDESKNIIPMTKSNDFGVGLMHEVAITASKTGWEPEDISNLSKNKNLMRLVHGVLRGTYEIKVIEHAIDCDATPTIPEGLHGIIEHKKSGILKLDFSKIELVSSKRQEGPGGPTGNELLYELKNKRVLNANVLDYLLKNPHIIPDDWKDDNGDIRWIYFFGTTFFGLCGSWNERTSFITGLFCSKGGKWSRSWTPLNGILGKCEFSAILTD